MIILENITKEYKKNTVLNNISVEFPDGTVSCIVGNNGAGKTTLLKIIAGLITPTTGNVIYDNNVRIGTLIGGKVDLYQNLTGYEMLNFFAELNKITRNELKKKIDEFDSYLPIKDFIDKKCHTFSRGMEQKIALCISMLKDPDVLILDEPSTGLDLESANDVIRFIRFQKKSDKTVIIASHNIFEISDLSDNLFFLRNGELSDLYNTKEFFVSCESERKSEALITMLEN